MSLKKINYEQIQNLNTVDQVAVIFGVSRPTIFRWIREGKFPPACKCAWSRKTIESYIDHCLQVPTKTVKMCAENMMGR